MENDSKRSLRYDKWLRLSLFYLVLVGGLGVLLRHAFAFDLPDWIDYRNITHTHSHLAMLGWIYNGLFLLIVSLYELRSRNYRTLFWITQITIIGMSLTFPVVGYAPASIAFTTLHILLSYVFIIMVFRDPAMLKANGSLHSIFLKTSLIFLFVSTLGTWYLGYLMGSGGRGTPLYYASVQFFLHFQFNGWFLFAGIGLLFKFLNDLGYSLDFKEHSKFYALFVIATCLTYALAITWSTPENFIFWTNSLGVIIQLLALWWFVQILPLRDSSFKLNLKKWTKLLFKIALLCLIFKILVQGLVAIPHLAKVSYTIKNFIIGFIHLLNLGIVTSFLLGLFYQLFDFHKKNFKSGVYLFLIGFIATELLLFLQGVLLWGRMGFLPGYYLLIWFFSLILVIGLLFIFVAKKIS